jgi:hypothetical protein
VTHSRPHGINLPAFLTDWVFLTSSATASVPTKTGTQGVIYATIYIYTKERFVPSGLLGRVTLVRTDVSGNLAPPSSE